MTATPDPLSADRPLPLAAGARAQPGAASPARPGRALEKAIYAGVGITIVGALALLALNGLERLERRRPALVEPPVLGALPAFELTERSGGAFGSRELAGSVYVADFIFTSCAVQCLGMSSEMAALQRDLPQRPDVKLVSITIDPANDTPERLRAYAERFQARVGRWFFLTGGEQEVRDLSVAGFKLAVVPPEGDLFEIAHRGSLVLVDREGRVRGYYDYQDANALAALRRDVQALLR